MSVTDSIDELLEDPDLWSRRGSIDTLTAPKGRSGSADGPSNSRPVYIPGEGADKYREGSSKEEPSLDELIAELHLDDELEEKPKRK